MIKKFFCIVLSAVIIAGAAVPGPVAALGDQSGAAVGSAMTEAGKSGAAGSSAPGDKENGGAVGEQTATGRAAKSSKSDANRPLRARSARASFILSPRPVRRI